MLLLYTMDLVKLLDSCDERCGWVVVLCGAIAKGSFGVPLKGAACSAADVDPLVFQTYKTVMCLLFSFLVLSLGVPFYFSPWGIASGLFWVPGGTAGSYAIRKNGLAASYGLWSSIIVMNSFVVGIFFFNEGVKDIYAASCAALMIMAGIGGMTIFSHPSRQPPIPDSSNATSSPFGHEIEEVDSNRTDEQINPLLDLSSALRSRSSVPTEHENPMSSLEIEDRKKNIVLFGKHFTQRQLGLVATVFTGVWGGSNLIPMHFARSSGKAGLGYIFSFASGSMIVLILMWIIRYFVYVCQTRSFRDAYYSLPSFHLKQLYFSGFLSGSLYSIGNICSILSVGYLGQGVGFSVIQSSMLISGIWGILYFKEIRGFNMIMKWFCSASVTIMGIIWLTYEHEVDNIRGHR